MTGSRGPKSKANALRPSPADRKPSDRMEAPKAIPPQLPDNYRAEVRAWWDSWLDSPQAARFAATDWQRLLMLAPLVEAYFQKPSAQLMAEIRQNEGKLGATPADRDRLGWKIEEPSADEPAPTQGSRSRPDPRKSKESR